MNTGGKISDRRDKALRLPGWPGRVPGRPALAHLAVEVSVERGAVLRVNGLEAGAIKGVLEALRDTEYDIFWAEFLLRPWCTTVVATAPFASGPAGILPAISRMRDSSSSTAATTGSSRVISNPSWPASSDLSAVWRRDYERETQAKDGDQSG